jgi:hypothetical protein
LVGENTCTPLLSRARDPVASLSDDDLPMHRLRDVEPVASQ